jgi:hypothetical protein
MTVASPPSTASLLQAYSFSEEQKHRLVSILAQSYLVAKAQAYQKAMKTASKVVRLKEPWTPGKPDAAEAQAWAIRQMDGIIDTYEEMLKHAVEQFASEEERAIALPGIVSKVKDWFSNLLPWKAKQITNMTWGTGTHDGTMQFIEDIQVEDAVEFVDESVQDLSNLEIQVSPAESSSDFCHLYAGNSYPLSEAESIPQFPAHPNCIHSVEIIVKGV